MENLLLFIPVVGYFIFATIMFMFRRFIFGLHASVLGIALIANFVLTMYAGGFLPFAIAQTVLAIIAFVLMVPFFAGKASGETMLAFTAMIGLPPLAKMFGESLFGFGLTLALFLVYAVMVTKKQAGGFSQIMEQAHAMQSDKTDAASTIVEVDGNKPDGDADKNSGDAVNDDTDESSEITNEDNSTRLGVKDTLVTGVYSTWSGELKLPDYSYLPDRKKTANEKRVSISVFALVSYSLVALSVYVYPLLFLDR